MEESEKLNTLFYGAEAAKKIKLFKEGLAKIEDKYSQYFSTRNAINKTNKIDQLSNHYITTTDINGFSFNYLSNSDLDENIRKECDELFREVFNNHEKL